MIDGFADNGGRRVLRYQRGNQNPYIEEQTIQCPKEKVQKTIYKTYTLN
jgi:hypothetical protein